MRKILFFLCALLTGVGTVWADESSSTNIYIRNANNTDGDAYVNSSYTYTQSKSEAGQFKLEAVTATSGEELLYKIYNVTTEKYVASKDLNNDQKNVLVEVDADEIDSETGFWRIGLGKHDGFVITPKGNKQASWNFHGGFGAGTGIGFYNADDDNSSWTFDAVEEENYEWICTIKSTDRGAWAVNGENASKLQSTNPSDLNLAYLPTDKKQQFALVPFKGKYYIYSIAAKKFVLQDGRLSDTDADAITMTLSIIDDSKYPYYQFSFAGSGCINISDGKLQVMSYNTPDPGNRFAVLPQFGYSLDEAKSHLESILSLELWKDNFIQANAIDNEKLGNIGYPTVEAYTQFMTTINEFTEEDDFKELGAEALTRLWNNVVYPSTGFYYLHNIGNTNRYALSDEDFDELTTRDLLNDGPTTAKHIWYVKANTENHNINVVSLRGRNISTDAGQKSDLSLETGYANNFSDGYGAFYVGCIQDPQQNRFTINGGAYDSATNPITIAYWDGDRQNTKAYWKFEEVDETRYDIYNVVVTGDFTDKYVTYTAEYDGNKNIWNGGWYFFPKNTTINDEDFTPEGAEGAETTVSIAGNTITVTYTIIDYKALVESYLTEDKVANVNRAGEYGYPKTTSEAYTNIKPYVDKLTEEDATWTAEDYENVQAYYEAYYASTDIVLPEAGKFYRLYVVTNSGAKKYVAVKDGKAVGTTGVTDAATSIWYYNDDKLTVFSDGKQYAGSGASTHPMGLNGTNINFHKAGTGALGVVNVKPNGINEWYIALDTDNDSNLNAYGNGTHAACNLVVEEVESLPVTISEAGLATFYSPVAVTADGVTAYTGSIESDVLKLNAVDEIPAHTAVILEGEAGTINLSIVASEAATAAEEAFTGTVAAISTPTDATILTLQSRDGGLGFYPYEGETLAGFKAYITLPATETAVKGIILSFGTTDAIQEVVKEGLQDTFIYDLMGRRVEKAVKGIYIVNGKKTVIK